MGFSIDWGCQEYCTFRRPFVIDLSDVSYADIEERTDSIRIIGYVKNDVGFVVGRPAALVGDDPGVCQLNKIGQNLGSQA